jgi:hypothetical protein
MMVPCARLLVEDDATIGEFVARGLREAGFASITRPTARPGWPPRPSSPTTSPLST